MLQTCAVTELNERVSEVEETLQKGKPVFLTRQGVHSMVVLSIEVFEELTADVEDKLDEADRAAITDPTRLTHQDVFSSLRSKFHAR